MSVETTIIHPIDSLTFSKKSFALYRFPFESEPVLKLQISGDVSFVEHITELNGQKGFVIAPFLRTDKYPIVIIQPDVSAVGWDAIHDELAKIELPQTAIVEHSFNDTNSGNKQQYLNTFNKFIEPLHAKQFEKLVLSRAIGVDNGADFSPVHAFINACERYPEAFVFLCHTPQTGTWLGSTQEVMLSGDKTGWHTVALAGTMPLENGQAPHEWDDKNKHEQALVADYIRHQLDSLQINITEKGPYTTQAGQLVHLKSDFYFSLPDNNQLGMLLNLLHPTPAVCGLPKKEAYQFILENEGYSRSYYSGFLGWLDPSERTDLYVNLRCMNIQPQGLTLYAGGGLLSSSQAESEWEETQEKMKTMQALL
jgi:isochorismate synthase